VVPLFSAKVLPSFFAEVLPSFSTEVLPSFSAGVLPSFSVVIYLHGCHWAFSSFNDCRPFSSEITF